MLGCNQAERAVGGRDDEKAVSREVAGKREVDAFLQQAVQTPRAGGDGRGRLIFALDATMSRQPTWDLAQSLQGRMFETTAALGGLDVQLVYFRGSRSRRAGRSLPRFSITCAAKCGARGSVP